MNFQRDTGPDHILLPSTETFPPGSHFGFYCSHHLELPGLYPGLKYRILIPTASESPLGQLGSVPRQVLTTGLTTFTYNNRKAQGLSTGLWKTHRVKKKATLGFINMFYTKLSLSFNFIFPQFFLSALVPSERFCPGSSVGNTTYPDVRPHEPSVQVTFSGRFPDL